ncbi:hypothetical protein MTO96_019745 [Rhipicephalus appendiculatus]
MTVLEPDCVVGFEEAVAVQEPCVSTFADLQVMTAEQRKDPVLRNILAYIATDCLPEDTTTTKLVQDLEGESEVDANGALWHFGSNVRALWIPQQLQAEAMRLGHDHPLSGHMGYFETFQRIREQYFWLGIRADVSRYVRACQLCQRVKPRRQKPKGLMSTSWAMEPMQGLSVDIIGPLPTLLCRHRVILVALDKFTYFVEFFPLRAQTSQAIVDRLVEVFCRHGVPHNICSDNGKPFVSKLWKQVMRRWGISDLHAVPYRPAGQVVGRHNTVVGKHGIMAYCDTHRDWDRLLPENALPCVHQKV